MTVFLYSYRWRHVAQRADRTVALCGTGGDYDTDERMRYFAARAPQPQRALELELGKPLCPRCADIEAGR